MGVGGKGMARNLPRLALQRKGEVMRFVILRISFGIWVVTQEATWRDQRLKKRLRRRLPQVTTAGLTWHDRKETTSDDAPLGKMKNRNFDLSIFVCNTNLNFMPYEILPQHFCEIVTSQRLPSVSQSFCYNL